MTQSEFKTYISLLQTHPAYFYVLDGIAECRGDKFCSHHTCPFTTEGTYGCRLQDRDKLTKAQLNKLNSDYPELLI